MANILTSLSAGSGIDVKTLVSELVTAERAPRQQLLDDRLARVTSRISAMATFRTSLDALVGALDTRVSSGALAGIPAVSDTSVLGFTLQAGGIVQRQQLEVRQLARGQTVASAAIADAAAPVGQGTLAIRFGSVAGIDAATGFTAGTLDALEVEIGPDDDSLAGLRNAINDAAARTGAPIQAQIVTDATGSRLLLRGSMGQEQGFIVETTGDPALAAFNFAEGTTGGLSRTQTALDALVAIDGVELRRPANIITDLVPGATLTLYKAQPGTPVILEAVRSDAQLSQAVSDIASALNELSKLGAELTAGGSATASAGALVSDSATRRSLQMLKELVNVELLPAGSGGPTRLNELGLTLDRYGNFIIDAERLAKAVEEHPAAIEAIVTAVNAKAGITTPAGPLRQIAASFALAADGSAGQQTALQREQAQIAEDQQKLNDRIDRLQTNYTRQFASVDSRVGQYKSLMSFLQQQIDLWTKSD